MAYSVEELLQVKIDHVKITLSHIGLSLGYRRAKTLTAFGERWIPLGVVEPAALLAGSRGLLPSEYRAFGSLLPVSGSLPVSLVPTSTPHIRFLFVGSPLCSTLPSDVPSRVRPCASLVLHLRQVARGLSPISRQALPGTPKNAAKCRNTSPRFLLGLLRRQSTPQEPTLSK